MLVAPGRADVSVVTLPGGAVLELLVGRGTITVGNEVRQVGPRAVVAADAGAEIRFDNRQGEASLEWRVTLIRQRRS